MFDLQHLKKQIVKPLINGGVSAVALEMITTKNQKYFNYGGKRYSVMALGVVLGIASSFAVEFASGVVLPHIPQNKKFQHLESMVLHIAGSAGVFALSAKLLGGSINAEEAKKFMLAGAVAEAVSNYVYENLIQDHIIG